MTRLRCQVAVVGAGPVGLTTALLLARQGVEVAVLEARPDLGGPSRASTWHPPTLEYLEELGVAAPLVAAGYRVDHLQYRHVPSKLVADFPYRLLADDTRFPFRLQAEQELLLPILAAELEARPTARLRFGTAVTGLTLHDDGAEVHAEHRGGPVRIRADWVVGADGAHSAVRRCAGIAFEGERYARPLLRVMTPFDVLAAVPGLAPVAYLSDDEGACSVLTLVDHWRVGLRVPPDEPEHESLSPGRIQARLRRFLPSEHAPYPVTDAQVIALHKRVAATFRRGRVVLAGDAAHLNNPSGGRGMNSGIHDAWIIGHALGVVLRGDDDSALDHYAHERREIVVERVIGASDEQVGNLDGGRRGWIERLCETAADPARARALLLQTSMFDSAPPLASGKTEAH